MNLRLALAIVLALSAWSVDLALAQGRANPQTTAVTTVPRPTANDPVTDAAVSQTVLPTCTITAYMVGYGSRRGGPIQNNASPMWAPEAKVYVKAPVGAHEVIVYVTVNGSPYFGEKKLASQSTAFRVEWPSPSGPQHVQILAQGVSGVPGYQSHPCTLSFNIQVPH